MGSGSSVEMEKMRAQDAPDDASDFTTLFDARKEIVRMRELLLDPLSDPALKAAAAAPRSRVEASTSPLQLSALTQADPTCVTNANAGCRVAAAPFLFSAAPCTLASRAPIIQKQLGSGSSRCVCSRCAAENQQLCGGVHS